VTTCAARGALAWGLRMIAASLRLDCCGTPGRYHLCPAVSREHDLCLFTLWCYWSSGSGDTMLNHPAPANGPPARLCPVHQHMRAAPQLSS
jgi:hypothetical protein